MAAKTVSVDEFLGTRKGFVTDDGMLLKAAKAPSSFNADTGTCRFVMSTEAPDRDRDIISQAGLDLTEFLKNPVAPFGHRAADFPIGSWEDVSKNLTGRPKRTEGTLRLASGDPVADRLKTHLAAGTVRACSIGFMPKSIERRELADGEKWTGYSILEAELYECSPVAIPAQPQALAKAAAANGLLPREVIEEILDTWTMDKGLLVPRAEYEATQREVTGEKTFIVFGGKQFVPKGAPNDAGEITFVPAPAVPDETERLVQALEKADQGVLSRLGKLFGLTKPEPTAEELAAAELAKDLPGLIAKHEMIDTEARLRALDEEIGQHCPA